MKDDAIIVLDPVNQHVISEGLKKGIKTFVGGNCTVSLMLMAIGGLFEKRFGGMDFCGNLSSGFRCWRKKICVNYFHKWVY